MKTQNRYILSSAAFLILSLVSLKAFPSGQTGTVSQNTSGTITGTVANPTGEMFSPVLQKCGKNYVETKLENFPLEGQSPEAEGGAWWACKLRPDFNYSNYDPNDNACPAVPGEEFELRTEAFQPINANYYGCSYVGKNERPTVQCLSGFHAIDVQESKKGLNPMTHYFQAGGFQGQTIKHYQWTSYSGYIYDSSFKCVRNGATFPEGNFEADGDACNPSTSWLGVWKGLWQGSWPFHQICGWKPESNAPVNLPSDDSSSAPLYQ